MATWTPRHGMENLPRPPASVAVNRLGVDGNPVPFLRGRIHEATAVPFAVAGLTAAALVDGTTARTAISIFTISVVSMLIASATYHCHTHSFESKLSARRLDHAMIFVTIAGTQTAYWLLVAPPLIGVTAILVVWVIAALGIHHKLNKLTLTETSGSWLYVALGWTGVALVPYLLDVGDAAAFIAVLGGGLVYSGGGAVLARRLVDPWPKIFGYHEVWHLMVVIGAATHFAGLLRLAATT